MAMWKLFFETCDVLCGLIPNRRIRRNIREQRLFDWRNKYNALRKKFPELNFRHTRMIKGGWNIGFIVDNRYVFKIRKFYDTSIPIEKIMREKRITDAFANISPLRIPKIEIVRAGKYTFYKYDFIPGQNLNLYSTRVIRRHARDWGTQLAEFIYAVHNARPPEIDDLRADATGDGWNHNDMCNNIIVDKKTRRVVGVIDWEYAGWGTLESEFNNAIAYSHRVRNSGIGDVIRAHYKNISNTSRVAHKK